MMHFQFDMSSLTYPRHEAEPPGQDVADLLRQLLAVQKEHLAVAKGILGAHDVVARWRAFLARWRDDFPGLAASCREIMPILERLYGKVIAELAEHLSQNGLDALDNDFTLQDFLDRYGMKLTQLGTILNLVAPFAEAGTRSES
jgi:hypothetical protein